MKVKSNALTIVPYNDFGKAIITEIRKLAKSNGWKVSLRGRNSNRKAIAQKIAGTGNSHWIHESLRRSLPLKYSDRVAVYVYNKGEKVTSTELFNLEKSGQLK